MSTATLRLSVEIRVISTYKERVADKQPIATDKTFSKVNTIRTITI